MSKSTSHTILVAEDSDDDVHLFRRAISQAGILNPVHWVHDGVEVISYLSGSGIYADRQKFPFPIILFLDWRMPRMDGSKVLEWISSIPEYRRLLVVVLTGMDERQYITKAYQQGANSFLAKPVIAEDLANLVKFYSGFWLLSETAQKRLKDSVFQQVELEQR